MGVRDEDFSYYNGGGPAIYRDKWTFFNNNRLDCIDSTDDFAYDASGLRIRKNDTHYAYRDGKLAKDVRNNGKTLTYLYSAGGIIGFMDEYRNHYYYQKNIQGDVIGTIALRCYDYYEYVAYYVYDAFDNHKVYDADYTENTSTDFIGNINPIRYREYYYDTETKLYFINNRYYDSDLCRYVSPDPKNGEIFKPNLDTRFKI
jgi:RHS repeat-associated protein